MSLIMFRTKLTDTVAYFIRDYNNKVHDAEMDEFVRSMFALRDTAIEEYARAEKANNNEVMLYLDRFSTSLHNLELVIKKTNDRKIVMPLVDELIKSTLPIDMSNTNRSNAMMTAGCIAVGVLAIGVGFVAGAGLSFLLGLSFCALVDLAFHTTLFVAAISSLQIPSFIGGMALATAFGKATYDYFSPQPENSVATYKLNSQVEQIGLFFSRHLKESDQESKDVDMKNTMAYG